MHENFTALAKFAQFKSVWNTSGFPICRHLQKSCCILIWLQCYGFLQVFHCVHFECPAQPAEGNEEQESSDSDSSSSHPMDTENHDNQQPQMPRLPHNGSPRSSMMYQMPSGASGGRLWSLQRQHWKSQYGLQQPMVPRHLHGGSPQGSMLYQMPSGTSGVDGNSYSASSSSSSMKFLLQEYNSEDRLYFVQQ